MSKISGFPRAPKEESDRKFNESLARGLDVLRAFQPGDGFLGNVEIARRTQLPKATVSRLTYTLTKLGYLTYSDRLEKYQLGSGVLALGYAFLSSLAIRQIARPLMQELANNTGTSVGLADRERLDMIYVEHCIPTDVTVFRHEIGDRVPALTTALGRAYLVALPEDEREYALEQFARQEVEGHEQAQAYIKQAVEGYKSKGFCSSMGEWNEDVNGVAVPLILDKGAIYSFNAGGPAYRVSVEYLEKEVAPLLKNMVANINATLVRY